MYRSSVLVLLLAMACFMDVYGQRPRRPWSGSDDRTNTDLTDTATESWVSTSRRWSGSRDENRRTFATAFPTTTTQRPTFYSEEDYRDSQRERFSSTDRMRTTTSTLGYDWGYDTTRTTLRTRRPDMDRTSTSYDESDPRKPYRTSTPRSTSNENDDDFDRAASNFRQNTDSNFWKNSRDEFSSDERRNRPWKSGSYRPYDSFSNSYDFGLERNRFKKMKYFKSTYGNRFDRTWYRQPWNYDYLYRTF